MESGECQAANQKKGSRLFMQMYTTWIYSSTLYVTLLPQISQRASLRRIMQAAGPQERTNFGTKPKSVAFLWSDAGKSDRKIHGWDFLLDWSLWQPYIYLKMAGTMALQQNSIPSDNDKICILWMRKNQNPRCAFGRDYSAFLELWLADYFLPTNQMPD